MRNFFYFFVKVKNIFFNVYSFGFYFIHFNDMNNYDKEAIRNWADFLYKLNGNELTLLATAIGLVLSHGLDGSQINVIGNFFEGVGQTMLIIGAQEQLNNSNIYYNAK